MSRGEINFNKNRKRKKKREGFRYSFRQAKVDGSRSQNLSFTNFDKVSVKL